MADGSVVIEITGDAANFEKKMSGVAKTAKTVLKGIGVAAGAIATATGAALAAIGKDAISAYADYEQLTGGVKTLFGTEAESIGEYAKSIGGFTADTVTEFQNLQKAQNTVFNNANNAYKTAGLSANEYMETVTSFAASLTSSLGGDTVTAAQKADQAVTDMADNANKMGSDMTSIQNAYQGFAKQNYTMLDNLKLGYGGTKEEMQRLLADAEKLSGVKYDISSYADIVDAIHVVQTEMGITGTTAKEAATTIQGSAASMKAAWQNLLVGFADPSQNMDQLISNMVDSVLTFADNLVPRIAGMLPQIATGVAGLVNGLITELPGYMEQLLPALLEGLTGLLDSLMAVLPEVLTTALTLLATYGPQIVTTLVEAIVMALPLLINGGLQIIVGLAMGIAESLPTLVPAIVEVVLAIVDALTQNVEMLVSAAIALIGGLATGIIQAIPILVEKAPVIIGEFLAALMSGVIQLIEAGAEFIVRLCQGVASDLASIGKAAWDVITEFASGIAAKISELWDAGKSIVEGLLQGIKSAWHAITDWISGAVNGVISTVRSLFGIHSPSKVFFKIGVNVGEGFNSGVKSQQKKTTNAVKQWVSSAIREAKKVSDKEIVTLAQSMAEKYEDAVKGLESKYQALRDKLTDYGDFSELTSVEAIQAQTDKLREYSDAMEDLKGRGASEDFLKEVLDLGVDEAVDFTSALKDLSAEEWDAYISAWEDKRKVAAELAQKYYADEFSALGDDMQKGINAALKDLGYEGEGVGKDVCMGIINGIRAMDTEVQDAAQTTADIITGALKNALDIHSPSRVMARQIGGPMASGIISGFEKEMKAVAGRLQGAVNSQIGTISSRAALGTGGSMAREIVTNNNTIREKIVRVEGDGGISDELVRMLNLRLKAEDKRTGKSLVTG